MLEEVLRLFDHVRSFLPPRESTGTDGSTLESAVSAFVDAAMRAGIENPKLVFGARRKEDMDMLRALAGHPVPDPVTDDDYDIDSVLALEQDRFWIDERFVGKRVDEEHFRLRSQLEGELLRLSHSPATPALAQQNNPAQQIATAPIRPNAVVRKDLIILTAADGGIVSIPGRETVYAFLREVLMKQKHGNGDRLDKVELEAVNRKVRRKTTSGRVRTAKGGIDLKDRLKLLTTKVKGPIFSELFTVRDQAVGGDPFLVTTLQPHQITIEDPT